MRIIKHTKFILLVTALLVFAQTGFAGDLVVEGDNYASQGEYVKAMKSYEEAIRLDPNNADAHFKLGLAYRKVQRWNEAVEAFKQAISINPYYADTQLYVDAHVELGLAYIVLKRGNEAVEAFKEATRTKRDYAKAHYGLGVAYLLIKDKRSALKEHEILKELDKYLANQLFSRINKSHD